MREFLGLLPVSEQIATPQNMTNSSLVYIQLYPLLKGKANLPANEIKKLFMCMSVYVPCVCLVPKEATRQCESPGTGVENS